MFQLSWPVQAICYNLMPIWHVIQFNHHKEVKLWYSQIYRHHRWHSHHTLCQAPPLFWRWFALSPSNVSPVPQLHAPVGLLWQSVGLQHSRGHLWGLNQKARKYDCMALKYHHAKTCLTSCWTYKQNKKHVSYIQVEVF